MKRGLLSARPAPVNASRTRNKLNFLQHVFTILKQHGKENKSKKAKGGSDRSSERISVYPQAVASSPMQNFREVIDPHLREMKMVTTTLNFIWDGPFKPEQVISQRKDGGKPPDYDGSDYGLYQIYGQHIIGGSGALLYVGE